MSPWLALALIVAAGIALCKVSPRVGSRPIGPALIVGAIGTCLAWLVPEEIAGIAVDRPATAITYGIAGLMSVLLWRRLAEVVRSPFGAATMATFLLACMTLGPMLRTDHGAIPTPALLVCRLPGLSAIRLSARWGIVMNLAAAGAFAAALTSIRRASLRGAACLLAAFLISYDVVQENHFDAEMPFPQQSKLSERAVDRILKALPREGAVMELPWLDGPKEVPRMMAIHFHGRPLVNGYAGMVPAFFAYHAAQSAPALINGRTPNDYEFSSFRAFGARYWVIHLDRMPPSAEATWRQPRTPLNVVAECDGGRTLILEDPAPSIASLTDLPSSR